MATITFSDNVPAGTESVHFLFPEGEFDLAKGASYETDDAGLAGSASVHPWLVVTYPAAKVDEAAAPNMADPHINPAADHLTSQASPEVVEAADAQQKAQAEANAGAAVPATAQTPVAQPTPPAAPSQPTAPAPAVASTPASVVTDATGKPVGATS